MTLQWATFAMAAVAAVGSLVRIYQNERLYRWHQQTHRKKDYLITPRPPQSKGGTSWQKLLAEAKRCFVEARAVPAKSPVATLTIEVEAVVLSYDPNTKVRLHCSEVRVVADTRIGRRKRIIGTPVFVTKEH